MTTVATISCNRCGAEGGCEHVGEADTPPLPDVLQEQPPPTVAVETQGINLVDQVPGKLGAAVNIVIPTGAEAVKLLNADPRRQEVILWAFALGGGCEAVCVAGTEQEANNFTGALIPITGSVPLRYDLHISTALWARGCVINDSTGTFTGIAVSTDDAILSVLTKQWVR